jgi:hypothetical protein
MEEKLREEILNLGCEDVYLITENDERWSIAPADQYVGGEGIEGFISDLLGNVAYSSFENCLNAMIEYIESNDDKIVDYDF